MIQIVERKKRFLNLGNLFFVRSVSLVSFLVAKRGAACYNGHEVILMEKIEHIGIYACPFGFFRIVEEKGAVVAIDVVKERQGEEAPSEVTDLAARELAEYLAGERQVFTFPYRLVGTPFRLKVWRELEKVPYGETTTYKKLAEAIGRPGAYHAVGGAVGANPLSIVVPCHRVIGTDGSLTGYAGGVDKKIKLLELERADMKSFFVPKKGTAL